MKETIDVHGMSVIEAKKYLKTYLNSISKLTEEVEVIHGYNSGTALQKYIRNDFNHKNIKKKVIGLNRGVTTFIVNKEN